MPREQTFDGRSNICPKCGKAEMQVIEIMQYVYTMDENGEIGDFVFDVEGGWGEGFKCGNCDEEFDIAEDGYYSGKR